jgi:gliding motility-associated lipoprotein GldD
MKYSKIITFAVLLLVVVAGSALVSCHHDGDYTPKPRTYLRFSFPEKSYVRYDTAALPFTFESAKEAHLVMKKDEPGEKYLDILYPKYKGVVFLTYKPMRGPQDLAGQIDTSYELLKMHFDYSSGVEEEHFVNPAKHIYSTTYHLKGSNVASTYQFWATDSLHHFLRGSLYLDQTPNNDSLAPVLEYLQKDLNHLIETLVWK